MQGSHKNAVPPKAHQCYATKIGITACLCFVFSVSAGAEIPTPIDNNSPDLSSTFLEAGLQGTTTPTATRTPLPPLSRQAIAAADRRINGPSTRAIMATRGWHADSVIAINNGNPITIRRALSDAAIFRLPSPAYLERFLQCLTRYGFARTHPDTREIEQTHNLPRGMLHAIAQVESRHYNCATSAGAGMGRYQFQDVTVRGLGLSDPYNAAETAQVAARHLADHLRRGTLARALAIYNCGIGCVTNNTRDGHLRVYNLPTHTQAYIIKVNNALPSGPAAGTPQIRSRPNTRRI